MGVCLAMGPSRLPEKTSALAFLILLAVQSGSAFAAADLSSIRARQNPFWLGASLDWTAGASTEGSHSEVSSQLEAEYGFASGVALQLTLPAVFENSSPSTLAGKSAQPPYIGGGFTNRIALTGFFRFWEEGFSYFGTAVGIGFPYQSDSVLAATRLGGWFAYLEALARYDAGPWAIEAYIYDGNTFVNSTDVSPTLTTYRDQSNTVQASVDLYYYPSERFSPFVSYSQTFPAQQSYSYNSNSQTFLASDSSIFRSQTAGAGVLWAPSSLPFLFSLEGEYLWSDASTDGAQITGGVRWLF